MSTYMHTLEIIKWIIKVFVLSGINTNFSYFLRNALQHTGSRFSNFSNCFANLGTINNDYKVLRPVFRLLQASF